MPIHVNSTEAQVNLDQLCAQAVATGDSVIIHRETGQNVVLISEAELSSLLETLYLFRSPANASRLLKALERAKAGTTTPSTDVEVLCKKYGLEQDDDLQDEIAAAS